MIKKAVTLGVFLCAFCLFSPEGECKMPPEFNHNAKPVVNYHYNNYRQNPFITPGQIPVNTFNNKLVKQNYKNPFLFKNKNVHRIGNQNVFYKNNLPYKIGNKKVVYDKYNRIKSIGNKPVIYRNGKIHRIGDMPVIYNNSNEIIRIGNWSVSYDA